MDSHISSLKVSKYRFIIYYIIHQQYMNQIQNHKLPRRNISQTTITKITTQNVN